MKDQHVIACIEPSEGADTVVEAARTMATRLHKGLILMCVVADEAAQAEATHWIARYGEQHIVMRGQWKTAINGLPAAFGGILAVAGIDPTAPRRALAHPATLRRQFAECKTAYLCVPVSLQHLGTATAALCVDYRRESKEKLIWASYLVRFCGSRLTVASPDYKDEGLRLKWRNNMAFLQKFFASLGVEYGEHKLNYSPFANPDRQAIAALKPDILVALTTDTRERDLADLLSGPPEVRLLKEASTPLLLLNQRDDLYVLCD